MATSRTSTTQFKRIREYVKREARREGQERCPYCRVMLDWDTQGPRYATIDHLVPHALGGSDAAHNLQVICARCNSSKGARPAPKLSTVSAALPLKVSRAH